jgi:Ion transport protein
MDLDIEAEQCLIEERSNVNRVFRWAYMVSESNFFVAFMALSIILNTLVLALDKYPVDLKQTSILEKVNIMFTLIFTLEMVIKMVAIGVKNYFKGGAFNIFDCVIVAASIADIFMANFILTKEEEGSGSAITALRGFRLLRIFKLAKSWKRFELLLETLGRTLVDIATFSILLFLFIFTFSLLGLELFAMRAKFNLAKDLVDPDGDSPQYNFDNFMNSFSTVFIILTNDQSSDTYFKFYRAVDPTAATLFFVLLTIIGQKILLNLFLAILLENFDESALKHKMHVYE